VSTLQARKLEKEANKAAVDIAKPSNVVSGGFGGGYKPLVASDEEARMLETLTGVPH
jgi:hypothetical protein